MKEQAYQAFMSAVNNENIRLLSQSKDGLSNIKLGLGITVSMVFKFFKDFLICAE